MRISESGSSSSSSRTDDGFSLYVLKFVSNS